MKHSPKTVTLWQLGSGVILLSLVVTLVSTIASAQEPTLIRAGQAAFGWHIETVDSTGDVGKYTSLALDSAGHPHISYYDYTNTDLKYARWTGSAWDIQTVDNGGVVGGLTSLALDSTDHPHISYLDGTNDDLKYAHWTGSTWAIETVDSGGIVGGLTSLVLDSAGNPRISYYDDTNSALKYARWTGSGWDIQTVTDTYQSGLYNSLALDATGNPHISYSLLYWPSGVPEPYTALEYARWTGSEWDIQTVEGAWGIDVGSYTSLALDAAGNPHISYHGWYGFNKGDLKYARWTGSAWDMQTVDSSGGLGLIGWYTSLALDSAGNPHISYYAWTNSALKYARWTGSAWDIQTVDSEGDVGLYTSLALNSAGDPHISYYDGTNGDLKYAYISTYRVCLPMVFRNY